MPLRRTLPVALASLALTSLATPSLAASTPSAQAPSYVIPAAGDDLRSPDARDAGARHHRRDDRRTQDLRHLSAGATIHAGTTSGGERSALAQEQYYSSYGDPEPRSQQPASADPSDNGIALLPFVLTIVGSLILGLGAGIGLHVVRTRRPHANSLAT